MARRFTPPLVLQLGAWRSAQREATTTPIEHSTASVRINTIEAFSQCNHTLFQPDTVTLASFNMSLASARNTPSTPLPSARLTAR